MHKFIIFVQVTLFIFSGFSLPVFAANVTMTTYYPAPSGNYDRLKARKVTLTPADSAPDCNEANMGVLYYNKAGKTVKVCNGTSGWGDAGSSAWKQNDAGTAVYPSGLDAVLRVVANVGVGINAPLAPLHVNVPAGQTTGVVVSNTAGGSAAIAVQGAASSSVNFGSAADGVVGYSSAKAMTFKTNGNLGMTLDNAQTLTVAADVKAQNVTATTGNITATLGSVTAQGAVSGASVTALTGNITALSGTVSGVNVTASGAVNGASVTAATVTASLAVQGPQVLVTEGGKIGAASGKAELCYETSNAQWFDGALCPVGMFAMGYNTSGPRIYCGKIGLVVCGSGPSCTPVNGGWGAWVDATACSKACDGGTKTQTRSCDSPTPACGGTWCAGENTQTVACNTQACACTPVVDGYWSYAGSEWSDCTGACGDCPGLNGGEQTRTAVCIAPSCGGKACSGPAPTESQSCTPAGCKCKPCVKNTCSECTYSDACDTTGSKDCWDSACAKTTVDCPPRSTDGMSCDRSPYCYNEHFLSTPTTCSGGSCVEDTTDCAAGDPNRTCSGGACVCKTGYRICNGQCILSTTMCDS